MLQQRRLLATAQLHGCECLSDSSAVPVRHQKEMEVTLPPGHYDVASLTHKIGELLYADQKITYFPAKSDKLDGTDVSRKAATYITANKIMPLFLVHRWPNQCYVQCDH